LKNVVSHFLEGDLNVMTKVITNHINLSFCCDSLFRGISL